MLISAKKSLEDEVKETMIFRCARKEEEDTCMYTSITLKWRTSMNYTLLFIQMTVKQYRSVYFFLTVTAEALQLEGTLHGKEGARLKPNTGLYNTV